MYSNWMLAVLTRLFVLHDANLQISTSDILMHPNICIPSEIWIWRWIQARLKFKNCRLTVTER
jgi:hypothetical protein